jgi:hypothetical protein
MLSRRAFSRTAELGQLYDANNDLLLPGSIIKFADLPKKMISENSTEYVEHNFLYADSTDDQYKHLDIDASLRLSLYAGLIEVGGSGKYLSTTKTNKKSIKGSFYYKLVKKDDELLLENIPFDNFDFNILSKGYCKDATHVIMRRQYGSDLFFTFESKNGNKELLKQIETRLEATFSKTSISTDISNETIKNQANEDIHVSFYGDAKPPSKYKGTIESVLECLTEIDEMTQKPNQMVWDLYPISMLQEIFESELINYNLQTDLLKSYDLILDEGKSNILFNDWDVLLENKKELDSLHKIIDKDDETHLRIITEKIRLFQQEIAKEYKYNIIYKIKQFKKEQTKKINKECSYEAHEALKKITLMIEYNNSQSTFAIENNKITIEDIIKNINLLNDKIFKFLKNNQSLLPKDNFNIVKEQNNWAPDCIVIKPNQIKSLKGISHIFLTNNHCITEKEHEQFKNFILKNKPTRLPHNYYYFCNLNTNNQNKKNLIRYIRLIQMDTKIDPSQRWTHIRSIKVYDIDGNEIFLHNKYIKLKYSSISEKWSTSTLLDDDNSTYFHTSNGLYEWIEIDLGSNMYISKVIVKNRIDKGNPNNNPERIIGHELQAFADYTLLGNKILVTSSEIVKKDYVYEFKFTEDLGILSDVSEYHINSFDKKRYSNIYTLWNSKILGIYKNSIVWNIENEIKNIPITNDRFMIQLEMPCPHNTSTKNNINRNWVCYQCNSITKICKYDSIWYMVCYECNVIVKLTDCYFNCNDPNHGKEPFPCDKEFDFDIIRPKYMDGLYIEHLKKKSNYILEYKSILIDDNSIIYGKNINNSNSHGQVTIEFDLNNESSKFISPFVLLIQKSYFQEDFIILNLRENNIKDINNINNLFYECDMEVENGRDREYYIRCKKDKEDYIEMKKEIDLKTRMISNVIYIQKINNKINISELEPESWHLKMIIIHLMSTFKKNILSNNQLRKSGKWYTIIKKTKRIVEFRDISNCECYINDIKVDIIMISPFTCKCTWKEPHKIMHLFRRYKKKVCYITIDSNLETLWYFEITNDKYNNGKMYKLSKYIEEN